MVIKQVMNHPQSRSDVQDLVAGAGPIGESEDLQRVHGIDSFCEFGFRSQTFHTPAIPAVLAHGVLPPFAAHNQRQFQKLLSVLKDRFRIPADLLGQSLCVVFSVCL